MENTKKFTKEENLHKKGKRSENIGTGHRSKNKGGAPPSMNNPKKERAGNFKRK